MDYRPNKDRCGCCRMNSRGCTKAHTTPLNTYDWLCDLPESGRSTDFVEVQFKNTRKGYYLNSDRIELNKGDIVAVESNPGHDVGTVTLTGKLVLIAMKRHRFNPELGEVRKVYRIAKPYDMERWNYAKSREFETMIEARQIAARLGLNMKIGDVEYQGDGNKAIFYYIADERVDFRQLIRVLADSFRVRIEMKQIGARQEAGRIGGTGSCGRQLCCSAWMTNFISVGTSAARYQDLSLNPQKLTGQCAKLKCCLNFEVDTYVEAIRKLPSRDLTLETKDVVYYHFKTDVFHKQISYSRVRNAPVGIVTIPAKRVYEVMEMNKRGEKPETLEFNNKEDKPTTRSADILSDNSLTRFDGTSKRSKRKGSRNENNRRSPNESRESKGDVPRNSRSRDNKPKDRPAQTERRGIAPSDGPAEVNPEQRNTESVKRKKRPNNGRNKPKSGATSQEAVQPSAPTDSRYTQQG